MEGVGAGRRWRTDHNRVFIFKSTSCIETFGYHTLHAEFCKSGQEFAFCRKTASQVGCGETEQTGQTARSDIKNVQVHICWGWNSSCTSSSVFLIKGKEKILKEKDSTVLQQWILLWKSVFWPLFVATPCFLCCIKLGPDCHPNITTFDTLELWCNIWKTLLVSREHSMRLLPCLVQRHPNVSSEDES